MEDTITIHLGDAEEEERRRRRRGRMGAGLMVGIVVAALVPSPPEKAAGGAAGVKPGSAISVVRHEAPIGPPLPATPPPPPADPIEPPRPARAAVTPAQLDFGDGPLRRVSTAQLAVIRNDGGVPIERVTASAPPPFYVTNGCRRGIAPGAECAVAVVFDAAEAGAFTGTLEIVAAGRRSRVALRAGAAAPPAPVVVVEERPAQPQRPRVLCFDPPAITFLTRGTKWVTLRNREAEPLQITSIRILRNGAVSPGHRIETNGCLGTLPPGGQCRFAVAPTRQAMLLHETVQIAVDAVDPATGRTHPVHRDTNCRK